MTSLLQRPRAIKRRTMLGLTATAAAFWHSTVWAAEGIEVLAAWARASMSLDTTAFFTIINHTTEADVLRAVSSPVAQSCVLQKARWKVVKMSLVPLASLRVPPMSRVILDSNHAQVTIKLTHAIDPKEHLPLTLTFDKAGSLEVSAQLIERLIDVPRAP